MSSVPSVRQDERGFTLVELLVGMAIGLVVMFAALTMMDIAGRSAQRTDQRMQAIIRGRVAYEDLTRQLRSQTCLGFGQAAIQIAAPRETVFYASLITVNGALPIQKRRLVFQPMTGFSDRGAIVEQVFDVASGTPPYVTWNTTPTSTRTVINDVTLSPGGPLFRYYKYNKDTSPDFTELTGPISDNDRAMIVKVGLAFDSFPDRGGDSTLRTVYQGEVFVRTADPTDPERSPRCI